MRYSLFTSLMLSVSATAQSPVPPQFILMEPATDSRFSSMGAVSGDGTIAVGYYANHETYIGFAWSLETGYFCPRLGGQNAVYAEGIADDNVTFLISAPATPGMPGGKILHGRHNP